MSGFDPSEFEPRWRETWSRRGDFRVAGPGDAGFDASRPKYYVLAMFPYPSGAGMHMGHALNYTSTDFVARYKRLRGYNVLHPIGFDAFGLPAEQYAVEHGVHPAITTKKNIETISAQLKQLGICFDWDRCFATTDPGYYKWTQWIFLRLYHSYYDASAKKAKPICDLVQLLEHEQLYIGPSGELVASPAPELQSMMGVPVGVQRWSELTHQEQEAFLTDYRLAYLAEVPVNWCPGLGTVLANEEVTNEGRSERGNYPVYKRPLKQWMLRITEYADRLLNDLDLVDWPEPIKIMQRNWIGRSEGATIRFEISDFKSQIPDDQSQMIEVFTTRPDTLFGATYMVLAPENPLVDEITTPAQRDAVAAYKKLAASKTDMDRQADTKEKTGVFTGAYAVNPATGGKIPVWVADYVLMGYGTGAIMAVPGQDERDWEFAQKYGLPIVRTVRPPEGFSGEAFTGDGPAMNSGFLDGLGVADAKEKMIAWLSEKGLGEGRVQYKLRDWLFSRQRYWGEPFPVLHAEDGSVVPVADDGLPVELPEMADFSPSASDDPDAPPRPPLGRAPANWREVEVGGERYQRELNTMPNWAGSCWYHLRFLDPRNGERLVGSEAEKYWMGERGVDLYIGGVEHAVLHLLYARFWQKVLFDLGHVSTAEPYGKLFNQGYVQAAAFTDARGMYVPAEEVEERGGAFFHKAQPVTRQFGKMGKSLKNSVSPDAVIREYGSDTLRLYLMYMGPLDASKPWEAHDIVGLHRFLKRVWRNFVAEDGSLRVTNDAPSEEQLRLLHKTIRRMTDDMDRLAFNTAIAALIELNNELVGAATLPRALAEPLLVMLAPLAPHTAEELWSRLGHGLGAPLADQVWPVCEDRYLVEASVEVVVQVMGKVRGRVTVATGSSDKVIEAAALADPNVALHIEGKTVRKVVVVRGKLVNIVVG